MTRNVISLVSLFIFIFHPLGSIASEQMQASCIAIFSRKESPKSVLKFTAMTVSTLNGKSKEASFQIFFAPGELYHAEALKQQIGAFAKLSLEDIEMKAQLGKELVFGSIDFRNSSPILELQEAYKNALPSALRSKILRAIQAYYPQISFAPKPESKNKTIFSGKVVGKLLFVKNEKEYQVLLGKGAIDFNSILVADYVPKDISLIAGLIITKPLSEMNHVAMLAKALRIPIVTDPIAFERSDIRQLDAKIVEFESLPENEYKLTLQVEPKDVITKAKKEAGTPQKKRAKIKDSKAVPINDDRGSDSRQFNHSLIAMMPTKQIVFEDPEIWGFKTSNLLRLQKVIPEHIDSGVAISAGFFLEALWTLGVPGQSKDLRSTLLEMQAELAKQTHSIVALSQSLRKIREAIMIAEPRSAKEWQNTGIDKFLRKHFDLNQPIIFRSSGIHEDSQKMNAAGLYESPHGIIGQNGVTSLSLFKEVLLSIFSDKAFFANFRYAGIQRDQSLAILIQPYHKDLIFNGVTILKRRGDNITINSEYYIGNDIRAVETNEVLPQKMQMNVESDGSFETSGNYSPLQKVLSKKAEVYLKIAETLQEQEEIDIEWGITSRGELIIHQARPVPRVSLTPESRKVYHLPAQHEAHWGSQTLNFKVPYEIMVQFDEFAPSRKFVTIKKLVLSTHFGKMTFLDKKAQFTLEEDSDSESEVSQRIRIPIPNYPGLKVLNIVFSRNIPRDRIAEASTEKLNLDTPWAPSAEISSNELSFWKGPEEVFSWFLYEPGLVHSMKELEDLKMTLTSKKFRIDLEISGSLKDNGHGTNGSNHFFYISKAVVSGLTTVPLILKGEKSAMSYPAHHDRSRSFVFDLYMAENMTEALRDELRTQNIRFIEDSTLYDSNFKKVP